MTRSWDETEAGEIVAAHRHLDGAMLPIVHALQEAFGYVDGAAVPMIAEALNVSQAEVHGVVSFYHDFRDTPPGRHVFKICRAEACQSMNSKATIDHLERTLGVTLGNTTKDGEVTLEAVYCLGNCALSPAAILDGKLHGRVTPARADQLLAAVRERPVNRS